MERLDTRLPTGNCKAPICSLLYLPITFYIKLVVSIASEKCWQGMLTKCSFWLSLNNDSLLSPRSWLLDHHHSSSLRSPMNYCWVFSPSSPSLTSYHACWCVGGCIVLLQIPPSVRKIITNTPKFNTHSFTHTHACTHARAHTHTHACTRTHTHVSILGTNQCSTHTCTHTYTLQTSAW